MTTTIKNSPHIVMWLAAVAIILFCLTGIAAIMGWLPSSMGHPADEVVAEKITATPSNTASTKVRKASGTTIASTQCSSCGVIESTRVTDVPGEGGVVGIAGGAVVGGLLGNQVGNGRGRDLATAVGAVGGAVAGNQIEKRMNTNKRYETTVRFDDGSSRTFTEGATSQWQRGDRVRVIDGVIRARG